MEEIIEKSINIDANLSKICSFLEEDNYFLSHNLNAYALLKEIRFLSARICNLSTFKITLSVLGTTSSGKSTFVNGLIGAKLAPMDKDELTAGTLRFKFNPEFKLRAKLTINDINYDTNFIQNYDDTYNYIKGIMNDYKKMSQNSTFFPEIILQTSYHLSEFPNFYGLEKNLNLEIIDLPGFKTIFDNNNFNIIKQNIKNTIMIFLFDYSSLFDDEKREKLFEVIKETSLHNTIFILNKIDLKNAEDESINKVINKCKFQLKKHLGGNCIPEIIALNSHMFYYIQSSLSAYYLLNNKNLIDQEYINQIILNNLQNCFTDHYASIRRIKKINKEFSKKIDNLENLLEKNSIPPFELFLEFWYESIKSCGIISFFESLAKHIKLVKEIELFNNLNELIKEISELIEYVSFFIDLKERVLKNIKNFKILKKDLIKELENLKEIENKKFTFA